MYSEQIYTTELCSACYFRTVAEEPFKKALIQLTERCNLHCKHCFVSSSSTGREISFTDFEQKLLPFLVKSKVKKVTLTGGEPFVHKRLLDIIEILSTSYIEVSICTNATLITRDFLESINSEDVHFNISLDGFSNESHGTFRGNSEGQIFDIVKKNIELVGSYGRLNGILVTPNIYSNISEYCELCEFAIANKARYVLMNPLSQFGRGETSYNLGLPKEIMIDLQQKTMKYNSDDFQVVYIRFPNANIQALSKCIIGKIYYIFTDGNLALCPYMVFAAKDSVSRYNPQEFLVGNVINDCIDVKGIFEEYINKLNKAEGKCTNCLVTTCGKGCYAAKIARGMLLEDQDIDLCPLG